MLPRCFTAGLYSNPDVFHAFLESPTTRDVLDQGRFIAYWVILGILSSVGLGSGLHTFVLFLGPHSERCGHGVAACYFG